MLSFKNKARTFVLQNTKKQPGSHEDTHQQYPSKQVRRSFEYTDLNA